MGRSGAYLDSRVRPSKPICSLRDLQLRPVQARRELAYGIRTFEAAVSTYRTAGKGETHGTHRSSLNGRTDPKVAVRGGAVVGFHHGDRGTDWFSRSGCPDTQDSTAGAPSRGDWPASCPDCLPGARSGDCASSRTGSRAASCAAPRTGKCADRRLGRATVFPGHAVHRCDPAQISPELCRLERHAPAGDQTHARQRQRVSERARGRLDSVVSSDTRQPECLQSGPRARQSRIGPGRARAPRAGRRPLEDAGCPAATESRLPRSGRILRMHCGRRFGPHGGDGGTLFRSPKRRAAECSQDRANGAGQGDGQLAGYVPSVDGRRPNRVH